MPKWIELVFGARVTTEVSYFSVRQGLDPHTQRPRPEVHVGLRKVLDLTARYAVVSYYRKVLVSPLMQIINHYFLFASSLRFFTQQVFL